MNLRSLLLGPTAGLIAPPGGGGGCASVLRRSTDTIIAPGGGTEGLDPGGILG